MVTEVICAICSSIACISYGIIAATCIRNAYIENPQKLSSILYNIGWLNTLGLFIIGLIFIPKMINISSFRDNIPLIGVLLFLIISGEISIFWVIKRCKPFADISFMPKEVIDSIAEIGENGTTESADFHR